MNRVSLFACAAARFPVRIGGNLPGKLLYHPGGFDYKEIRSCVRGQAKERRTPL